jgi:hypothetical protein
MSGILQDTEIMDVNRMETISSLVIITFVYNLINIGIRGIFNNISLGVVSCLR